MRPGFGIARVAIGVGFSLFRGLVLARIKAPPGGAGFA